MFCTDSFLYGLLWISVDEIFIKLYFLARKICKIHRSKWNKFQWQDDDIQEMKDVSNQSALSKLWISFFMDKFFCYTFSAIIGLLTCMETLLRQGYLVKKKTAHIKRKMDTIVSVPKCCFSLDVNGCNSC